MSLGPFGWFTHVQEKCSGWVQFEGEFEIVYIEKCGGGGVVGGGSGS